MESPSPPPRWPAALRAARLCAVGLTITLLGVWIAWWGQMLLAGEPARALTGIDLTLYLQATDRWLNGGPWYQPWQLAGPYPIEFGAILYPPPLIALFAPFLVLPVVLWWALPLIAVAFALRQLHPAWWSWPVIAACLAWPDSNVRILSGNPVMWFTAALALGALWSWPSPFVLLKPTLAPFALVGIRTRRWWLGLGAVAAVSLAFLPMWSDYVVVLRNAQPGVPPIAYSIPEWPLVAIPAVAYLARRRR